MPIFDAIALMVLEVLYASSVARKGQGHDKYVGLLGP